MPTPTLSAAFLSEIPSRVRASLGAASLASLEHLVERGRRAWPDLPLAPADFVAHLAQKLTPNQAQAELARVHAEDLWLTCACTHAITGAREALEHRYFPELGAMVARVRGAPSTDDVLQELRVVLFFGRDGTHAHIADYSGRGRLQSWLRAAAMRTALNAAQLRQPAILEDDEIARLPQPGDSPELELLKLRCKAEFGDAVRAAMGRLSAEQQNLLRLFYLDQLSCAEIGKLHQSSAPTVSRRLAEARAELLRDVRATLMSTLAIGRDEVNSMLRVLGSQLDVVGSSLGLGAR